MKKNWVKPVLYSILALGLAFSLIASRLSEFIENSYSTRIYYWTIRPYSLLIGIFPFSLTELVVVSITVFIIYKLVKEVLALKRNPREYGRKLPKKAGNLALVLAVIFLAFNLMWGWNYSRMTFADISGLPVQDASVDELAELAGYLTYRANELREQVKEDEQGVMTLNTSIRDMFSRAHLGFDAAGEIYPELRGNYGRPKGVFLSPLWSYTGIGGMYFPFTAEANVNTNLPHWLIPSTTTHEMAHQRGFAREDEANYIGYLTSVLHPDPDFQYSGVMLALMYTMNALHRYDTETWSEIRSLYSDGVNRDFQAWREYRIKYDGMVQQVSTNINDTYLRANRQTDGTHSYGRMVDLMLAEFRVLNAEEDN